MEIRARGRRGRIVVHFETAEDFDRLFGIMTGRAAPAQGAADSPPERPPSSDASDERHSKTRQGPTSPA